jgi:CRP/FNR family transcriptional regulator, cyclic AMP receptor protein
MLIRQSQVRQPAPRDVPTGSDGFRGVRLLDAEPDFAAGLSESDLAAARRHLVVPALRLPPGPWTPPEALHSAIGVLVTSGMVVRRGTSFARPDIEILGSGDLIDGRVFTAEAGWQVLAPVDLVVLDDRFVRVARHWPALVSALARRLFDAQHEHRTRARICAMPRVEERILGLLGHLAHRWGRVTAAGITLALPITHEVLGILIGARRPTVTLALKTLAEEGRLTRLANGDWLLAADCDGWSTAGIPAPTPPMAA